MNQHTSRVGPVLLALLPALATTGCSSGGGGPGPTGGGGTPSPKFLEIEARVDNGGSADARVPELLAVGQRLYVLFVDDRNGVEELFLNRSFDGGKSWLPKDVRIPGDPNGPLGVDPNGRKLAINGKHVVVVFEESDDMFTNVSHDGGLTWKPSATRLDPGGINAFDSDDPTVLFANGSFYAVWEDEVNGDADAYFSRSDDMGDTWTTAVQVNASAPGTTPTDYLWMDVASTGDIYVGWADDRNSPGSEEDIFFSRSSDNGATWLVSDVQIDEGLGDCSGLEIESNGSSVYAVFRDNRTGDYGIYFQRSMDGGDTWAASDLRLDSTPGGTDATGVDLRVAGNLVVVGWGSEGPSGDDDLFLAISQDGGSTWLPGPMRLDQEPGGSGDSDDLQLELIGQTIVTAWEDTTFGLDDIFLRFSPDGGVTWSNAIFVEETAKGSSDSSRPDLGISASGIWVAWQDDRNGSLDMFVNGGVLVGAP